MEQKKQQQLSDDPLEMLGFGNSEQNPVLTVTKQAIPSPQEQLKQGQATVPTKFEQAVSETASNAGGNTKFSVEVIHSHIKNGGTIELVPVGSKAILVRQEFNPAIQTTIDALKLELGNIKGISTQEDAAQANISLKKAKQLIKTLEEERKLMTSVLDGEKKMIMALENKIIGELEALTNTINGQITLFQNEELRKKREEEERLRRERDEEIRKQQEEIKRKQEIQNNILAFENASLKASAEATIDDIDARISKLGLYKLDEKKYMEFMPEAEVMYQRCVVRLNERKAELMELEQVKKTNAEQAKQLEEQQKQKAAFDLEAQEHKASNINEALQEERQEGIANAQMGYELKAAQAPEIKGVTTQWTFEIVDENLVPSEYKVVDEKKVKEAIKAGNRNIPGLKIYDKLINTSR